MNEKEKGIKKIEEEITKAIGDADEQALVRAIGALKELRKQLKGNLPGVDYTKYEQALFKDKAKPILDYSHAQLEKTLKKVLNKADLSSNEARVLLKRVISEISKLKLEVPSKFKVEVTNQEKAPDNIKVKNFPKSVDVSNFPKTLKLDKPGWWKDPESVKGILIEGFTKLLKQNKETSKVQVINSIPQEAIPVRLTDRDGKRFYDAVITAISGAGGPASFRDGSKDSQRGLVDGDGHVQVDVVSGAINLTESTDFNGGPVTVGTVAVEMTFTGQPNVIQLQADHGNSGDIWWGKATVDSSGNNAMGRLVAGEAVSLDYNDTTNAVYAVASAASQKVFKVALI